MQLTVYELLNAVEGTLLYGNSDTTFEYVSTDSRAQMTTELFIPIVGETLDAHQYIENAVSNGAVGFLTQKEEYPCNAKFAVLVADTTKALGMLASYVLKKADATVIGITGSVGKTTTRQFVAAVTAQLGKTLATEGNFNNHIGLPLTVLKLQGDEKYVVLEMGMNHFGEISYLSKIACPDIGIITMIGTSHIEFLGSRENILKAKAEILDGMKSDGILLLNGDNDLLSEYHCNRKTVYFGEKNAKLPYQILSDNPQGTFVMDSYEYTIPLPGAHNIQNASAAVLLGKLLGATDEQIQAGLRSFQSVGWRQKTERFHDITLIADCYNASLDSDKAALAVLKNTPGTRKVAVLGPIGELGAYQEGILEEVGKAVVKEETDCLILIEEESAAIQNGALSAGMPKENIMLFSSKEEFLKQLPTLFEAGDVILLKASRKYRFEELYEQIKQYKLTNKE